MMQRLKFIGLVFVIMSLVILSKNYPIQPANGTISAIDYFSDK